MRRKFFIVISALLGLLLITSNVYAHANLNRTEPAANSILDAPPEEIRLFFTEPLEPDFSSITLIDATGTRVALPPSEIDAADAHQMFIRTAELPNGLYTVQFRVVSAADGHPTIGQFPLTIGLAGASGQAAQAAVERIPPQDSTIRWLNFLSQAIAVGSIGFWLFVWSPAVPVGDIRVERRINRVIWVAWILLGISAVFMLMMQTSLTTGIPLGETISSSFIPRLISGTRYGQLWLIRIALWLGFGVTLLFTTRDKWFLWVALLFGLGTLMTTSAFSHASAAPTDANAAILADWLHLGATALWVGGLIQFFIVIATVRRWYDPAAPTLSALVGNFSNFARVAIAGLALTGFYATWLHVNSLEALLTTLYGNLLILKLAIFAPVILIAAINLILTHRRLRQGEEIWGGRLRGLVAVEIILTVAVLVVVGAMTSISPAKNAYEARLAVEAQQIQPNPIVLDVTTNNVVGEMTVSPGYIGNNTFSLKLTDADNNPIEDASRIRLLFRNLDLGGGDSELRMEHQGEGVYVIEGANISSIGEWRMRATVAIPDQFDRLYDFVSVVEAAPLPPEIPEVDPNAPLPNRVPIMLAIGLLALGVGGFFLGESRLRLRRGGAFVATGLVIVGVAFLVSSLGSIPT